MNLLYEIRKRFVNDKRAMKKLEHGQIENAKLFLKLLKQTTEHKSDCSLSSDEFLAHLSMKDPWVVPFKRCS